jgi:hypothetical protein
MINPTGKKLEKILFGMFDDASQGVDIYNHNGSLWIIFTDEMRWVLEFNKDRTLYYNYTFFRNEMEMLSLDCVENKYLIQKWFESRFLNINTVEVDIQNGVKRTLRPLNPFHHLVEDTIQNGVKDTFAGRAQQCVIVEDTIQNGVKHTRKGVVEQTRRVEYTIQNGVKKIHWVDYSNRRSIVNAIRDGIKEN